MCEMVFNQPMDKRGLEIHLAVAKEMLERHITVQHPAPDDVPLALEAGCAECERLMGTVKATHGALKEVAG